jgi:hypothetical protein
MTEKLLDLDTLKRANPTRTKSSKECLCDKLLVDTCTDFKGTKYLIPLHVEIHRLDYGPYLRYTVTTSSDPKGSSAFKEHPFMLMNETRLQKVEVEGNVFYLTGEIVADNSLTQEMLKYLSMDSTELEKVMGNSSVVRYRANILASLAHFWD